MEEINLVPPSTHEFFELCSCLLATNILREGESSPTKERFHGRPLDYPAD